MKYYGKLYGEERGKRTRYWDTGKTGKDWERIEQERDAMKAWIMHAAPMLSAAACILIDESIERLGEIEGVRAVLELCPVDYQENDQTEARN